MIRELVVVSGKGGTGKTCITAAFSSLAKNFVLCDADVDAYRWTSRDWLSGDRCNRRGE